MQNMHKLYRCYARKLKPGKTRAQTKIVYYIENIDTGEQESLRTSDKLQAERLTHARNETHYAALCNRQIGRAYFSAADPEACQRTWQYVFDEIVKLKKGSAAPTTATRWEVAVKDKAFDPLRKLKLVETRPEHFLKVLLSKKVSTNVYLRKAHNFAVDWNWLAWPVIAKKQFPKINYKDKRAITLEEHHAIIARERNPERRAFYELLWEFGASQGDLAKLCAEEIDWQLCVISFRRSKTGQETVQRLSPKAQEILRSLPATGPLFPYLRTVRTNDRSTEFRQRCQTLKISGISLHSYRYAWAERAQKKGYPERYAQKALGHGSKALARYYARNAIGTIPSLEEFDAARDSLRIVPVKFENEAEKFNPADRAAVSLAS